MAQEKNDDSLIDVENIFSKTELYFEENKRTITIVALIVIGLVGGYFAYKYLYVAGEEEAASKEMFKAEQYFSQDNYDKAINGDGKALGFAQIVDDYGITPSGNLAQYYLGISLLKTGKYEEAIEHLEDFDGEDQIVGPQATAAIGDAYMEMGKTDEAITYYLKAAEQNSNSFTTPLFLKKAALANEQKGSCAAAIELYERIKNEFPKTEMAAEMDKYIGRAKIMGNIQ